MSIKVYITICIYFKFISCQGEISLWNTVRTQTVKGKKSWITHLIILNNRQKWWYIIQHNVVSLLLYHQSSNLTQSRMGLLSYHMFMKRTDIRFLTKTNSKLVHSGLFYQERSQMKRQLKIQLWKRQRWRDDEEKKCEKNDKHKEEKLKKNRRWIIEWSWKICQSQFSLIFCYPIL